MYNLYNKTTTSKNKNSNAVHLQYNPAMKVLIKQATILQQASPHHLQVQDVLIAHGKYIAIENDIATSAADKVIYAEQGYLTPGFVDAFAQFNEPGHEHNETLHTGAAAAFKGGYTTVCVVPNTTPCIDNKATIEYIIQQQNALPVHVHPIGAVTTNPAGKLLTEMIEMHHAGAVAFSDGLQCIQQPNILLKALQYVKAFNGIVMQLPHDHSISATGYMHEGIVSTQLGIPGMPSIAEEVMVARDIAICAYSNSKLHITGISTAQSVGMIAAAKAKGIAVTCSVSPYHLLLNHTANEGYNTNAKVNPPLRTPQDVLAMQQGLLNGSIDYVASHHNPLSIDHKLCEYNIAAYGMSTIEHTFNVVASIPYITPYIIHQVLSHNAAQLLGIATPIIHKEATCSATLFALNQNLVVNQTDFISKSTNSAFIDITLKGKIIATLNKQQLYIA